MVVTEKIVGLFDDMHKNILSECLLFFKLFYDLRDIKGHFMLFIFLGFFLRFRGSFFIFFFHLWEYIIINRNDVLFLLKCKVIY